MAHVITLNAAGGTTFARVAPELGFNCFDFQTTISGHRVRVLDADPAFPENDPRPSGHGIPILFPFPNRIRAGKFQWDGRDFELPPDVVPYDRTGNAIHGFCLDRPWRVVAQDESSVTGEFQLSQDAPDRAGCWPADFLIRVTWSVEPHTLMMRVRIENPDNVPLPWGFGTHPYFHVPLVDGHSPGSCLVEVPVRSQWELQECLPTGQKLPLPEECELAEGAYFDTLQVDDVFGDLQADERGIIETLVMDEEAGLQVVQRFTNAFRHAIVYTPPTRTSVCIEPYTCLTDAIHLDHPQAGWETLAPGASRTLEIGIGVTPVLA